YFFHGIKGKIGLVFWSCEIGSGIVKELCKLLHLFCVSVIRFNSGILSSPPAPATHTVGPVDMDSIVFPDHRIFPVPGIQLYNGRGARDPASPGSYLCNENSVGPHAFHHLAFGIVGNDAPHVGEEVPHFVLIIRLSYGIDLYKSKAGVGSNKTWIDMFSLRVNNSP